MKFSTLLRLIAERMNPEEIIDILGLSSAELALLFKDEIAEKSEEFLDFLDFTEFDDEV